MNNKEIFSKAFSCLTPLTDNEIIFKNVTERVKKMDEKKKLRMKKPFVVLIAAALGITATTVTAGAVTGWDFNSVFDSVFKQKTEAYKTIGYQEYESGFDFKKYGKELDLHYRFDNYALNIKGVIADESTAYIVYDVVFDKDYDYGEKEKYTPWEMKAILETADKAMHTNDGDIISVNDNCFTFYKTATGSMEDKTLLGNTLVIDFYGLIRGIENSVDCDELYSEEQALECGLTVEIPVDFPLYKPREITVPEEKGKANLIDWKNGEEIPVEATLETISLSPLSCDLSFMTGIPAHKISKGDCYGLSDFSFTDDEGNEVKISYAEYSIEVKEDGRMNYHVPLNQPIEPDKIKSITIGGTEIILN